MIYLWLQLKPLFAVYPPQNSTDNLLDVFEKSEKIPLTHVYAKCIEITPIDVAHYSSSENENEELKKIKYDFSMINIDEKTSTIVFDDYSDNEMIYNEFGFFTTNNSKLFPLEVDKQQTKDDTKTSTVLFDNPICFIIFVIIVAVMLILGIVSLVFKMYWLLILASFTCVTSVVIWFIVIIYSPILENGKIKPIWY